MIAKQVDTIGALCYLVVAAATPAGLIKTTSDALDPPTGALAG